MGVSYRLRPTPVLVLPDRRILLLLSPFQTESYHRTGDNAMHLTSWRVTSGTYSLNDGMSPPDLWMMFRTASAANGYFVA